MPSAWHVRQKRLLEVLLINLEVNLVRGGLLQWGLTSYLSWNPIVEKLANTERHLDVSKSHSQRAEDRTDELKQLNRSIFRPVITFNKDAKRAAQEAKIQQRYEDERDEREKSMMDIRETQNRLGQASAYGQGQQEEGIQTGPNGGRAKTATQQALQREQRKRYQFEATASDDDMEDELDDNLDEISDVAKRLKALGSAMGQELDNQNNRIERIEEKTVSLDNRVFRNTERVCRYALIRCLFLITLFTAQTDQVVKPLNLASSCLQKRVYCIWTVLIC
jgi:hypothetical protein